MVELLEQALLSGMLSTGHDLSFRRIDGDRKSQTIYFLPWHLPYELAKRAGMLPLNFLACYQMPIAIISSIPQRCVDAMELLVADAEDIVSAARADRRQMLIIGLSIGNFPATILANRWSARLCSVCSADRGDCMIWESPAAQSVKAQAIAEGFTTSDFERALDGYHPIQNLDNLAPQSYFFSSRTDPVVPEARVIGLEAKVAEAPSQPFFISTRGGHFPTMIKSGTLQLRMSQAIARAAA